MEISCLKDYVGQEDFKKRLKYAISSSLIRNTSFPHTIMAGPPGLGKSTLAQVIAKELECPLYYYLATSIESEKHIEAIFAKLDKSGYNIKTGKVIDRDKVFPEIIFIDEIHNLSRRLTEMLHTALENRTITLKKRNFEKNIVEPVQCWVPEFCLIGATNYLGSLSKPFRDRFQITLTFEIYNDEEIEKVITTHTGKMGVDIEESAIKNIAPKSRGVPRIAISFLNKSYDVAVVREQKAKPSKITNEDVKVMFESEQIDEFGLNQLDRKALSYLVTVSRPIGLKSLAQAIDEDMQTVENIIEPYLVKIGFIIRTGTGRFVTEKGKDYLNRERPETLYPIQNS